MKAFKKKFQELVYSFSTEDRYADYGEDDRISRADSGNGNDSSVMQSNNGSQIQLADFVEGSNSSGNDGISETLLAWRHIDSWAMQQNPDLAASLSDPCTRHDINNAEKDLGIIFPASVRASLRIHDGQEDLESLTGTSGLIFGLQLMSLDVIVQMTRTWRNVAENLQRKNAESKLRLEKTSELNGTSVDLPSQKQKGYGKVETQDYKSMNPNLQRNISQNYKKQFKLPDIPNQHSVPPLAIQTVYAHANWIPLVTDNSGNHIGVDLAPGPKGKYGQVILFGREFDTKFVVANNWGDFLLSFANDLESGNWLFIKEDDDEFAGEGELFYRDKKSNGPVRDYLEICVMRSRMRWNAFREKQLPPRPSREEYASQDSHITEEEATEQETTLTVDEKLDEPLASEVLSPEETPNAANERSGSTEVDSIKGDKANQEIGVNNKSSIANEISSERVEKESVEPIEDKVQKSEESKDEVNELNVSEPALDKSETVVDAEVSGLTKDSPKPKSIDKLKDDFENIAL